MFYPSLEKVNVTITVLLCKKFNFESNRKGVRGLLSRKTFQTPFAIESLLRDIGSKRNMVRRLARQ